jgi:D-glycero-D-manno-heptose 1,7-bisphosphate phosphatase
MSSRPCIFLDRDGVLNKSIIREGKPYPPRDYKEFEWVPGAIDTCLRLKKKGYLLVIVTNQPDITSKLTTWKTVHQIHAEMLRQVPFNAIKVCTDLDEASPHKKPNPGMLLEAAKELNIDLARSWMVGDRWRDIGAGANAGCKTVWIDCGYQEKPPENPDFQVKSIQEAADMILTHKKEGLDE